MKRVVGILLVAVLMASCQEQKQRVFNTSAEIDAIKKLDAAFASGDWDTFRATFADSAQIWTNTSWSGPSISADTLTARYKAAREGLTQARLADNVIYAMIEYDNGARWVHRWGIWEATLSNGKSTTWTSNANFKMNGGKISRAGYIFNALPTYLASQPEPTPMPAK